MKLSKFSGGIHPSENKITATHSIEVAPIPNKVYLPLSQHIGAPAEPIVKKGDRVKVGQLIAEGKGLVSASIHASISGTVTGIEPWPHPSGAKLPAIIIEHDKDVSSEYVLENNAENPFNLSIEELKNRIKAAGVVGLGGAAFPTHVKLSPPPGKTIDTVIINGAECEPYITADHRLMVERPQHLIAGAGILMKILGAKEAIIAVEKNKQDAIDILNEAKVKAVSVVGMKVKYPQGSEKHLIKTVLDRLVPPPPGLPSDVGVVVQNVSTTVAVWEAVKFKKPLIDRVLTVTGMGINDPKNLIVRFGTPVQDLIDFCGGLKAGVKKIIAGGPMMGISQYTTEVPVIKGTSGIVAQLEEEITTSPYRTCIRCGNCVANCPCLLMPNLFSVYAEHGLFEKSEENHVMYCLECGCCSYVCPSRRPIVQWVRQTKAELRAKSKK